MSNDVQAVSSPGLERGLAILELLAAKPSGLTLSELADALSLPPTSVYRIGKSLEQLGYVDREPKTKRFTITNKFLRLGQPVGQSRALTECAIEPMRQVRSYTGETTQLCCLIDTDIVIVEQLLSIHPFKYSGEIGARCPCYSSAPGKAIAAFLPENEQTELVNRLKFKPYTATTITSKKQFQSELSTIQQHGYALDRAEGFQGIHCIAAPILDQHQTAIAAITIAGPAERIPEDEYEAIGQYVKNAASMISQSFIS